MWHPLRRLRAWRLRRRSRILHGRSLQMSEAWLKAQQHQAARIEYHGPAWQWPIAGLRDNVGWINGARVRRSA